MTHRVRAPKSQIPRAWLIPSGLLVALLAAVAAGLMSRAVGADFLAWWPVWVGIGLLGFFTRSSRIGQVKASGVLPILVAAILALFVVAYFQGWPVMPSASISLKGPPAEGVESAVLSVRIDGDLEVAAAELGEVYEVQPQRGGGDVGYANALEQVQGASFSVALEPVADPGIYRYAGWSISMDTAPEWKLTLEGSVTADLRELSLSEIRLVGEGEVSLGAAQGGAPVSIDGDFVLVLASGSPASVIGDADVPPDWTMTSDGWRSPIEGEGWVISTAPGASLSLITP